MRYAKFVFLAVFAACSLNAQEVTAGIYGTVQDASSAVIPNAAIVLHNVDTGRDYQTVSDTSGAFSLTLIPMVIIRYGPSRRFKKAAFTGVTLLVNDKRRVDSCSRGWPNLRTS